MATQDDYIRTALRVPPDLHAQIHEAAKSNNRTFNAEIVARLQSTFAATSHGVMPPMGGGASARSVSVERMLESLPADLSTQYGLHLYNTELKVAQAQLEEAREEFQPAYDKLQHLLAKEDGPPGPKARAKEAVSAIQRRIGELEKQVKELDQTISNIHFYRKTQGLPELKNTREVSVTMRIGGGN